MAKTGDNIQKGFNVFANIFSNPIFISVASILVALVLAWTFIGPLRDFFSNIVDGIRGWFSRLVGEPESQQTNERTRLDNLKGLFAEDDRALSDLVDAPLDFFGAIIFGTESETPSGI